MNIHTAKNASANNLRNFGILVGGAFLLFGGYGAWRGGAHFGLLLGVGSVLVFLGIVAPTILRPFYGAWMALGTFLGVIMTHVILIIFFYLIITPIGFFLRLFSKRFFDRRFKTSAASYWNRREPRALHKEDLEKQF